MVWYHLAELLREPEIRKHGEEANPAGCFPHRIEDVLVLQRALKVGAPCARAAYYLGNLLYDKGRYEEAAACWEQAVRERDDLSTPHRNLAIAYFNKQGRWRDALEEMERAFSMDPASSRLLFELDMMKKKMSCGSAERLAFMQRHMALVDERDDLSLEYITCLNVLGKHEEALKLLTTRRFHPWEGGEGKQPAQWRHALIALARRSLREESERSLNYLRQAAGSYPENFGEGKLEGVQENDIYYYMGLALRTLWREGEAKAAFRHASGGLSVPVQALCYND